MRIIAKSTLRKFWESGHYADAVTPVKEWYHFLSKAKWATPQDLKADLGSASILKGGRAVFNVAGNKYRVVAAIDYEKQIAWIRFVGAPPVRSNRCGDRVMDIKLIRNEEGLQRAFARMEELWGARTGTDEGDELELLSMVIEKYEDQHYEMPASDPIEAIRFRMDQDGLAQRDLEVYIGSSGRVSEVLNKKRPLTIGMIKRLHNGLNIPYESLLAD